MVVITPEFIELDIQSGPLTRVDADEQRLRDHATRPIGTSSLVVAHCEEILDTENSEDWYDDVIAELTRRGFSFDQIDAMRRFAWKTAGWLNYDRMLWEDCHLDAKEIELALAWQLGTAS